MSGRKSKNEMSETTEPSSDIQPSDTLAVSDEALPPEVVAARKQRLDVSKIFLSYAAYCGDVLSTARACDCTIADVQWLSTVEDWPSKLRDLQISPAARSAKDITAALNSTRERARIACYVQALRLRGLIDQTLKQIYEDPENILKYCQERDKRGNAFFSTKPLKELTDATEKVHSLIYRALGDVITDEERNRSPEVNVANLKELHLTVINAMSETPGSNPINLPELKAIDNKDEAAHAGGYIDVDAALGSG